MGDVGMTCERCELRMTLSEYAAAEGRVCMACGGALRREEGGAEVAAPRRGPTLRRRRAEDAVSVRGEPLASAAVGQVHSERVIPNAVTDPRRGRTTGARLLGFLVFLAGAALLVGPQFLGEHELLGERQAGIFEGYLRVRYIAWGAIWLLVAIEAWRESAFRGLAATLFPPYTLFYAVGRLESHWRRSLVYAACLALVAELHLLGSDAALRRGNDALEQGIAAVSSLIVRAGEPPMP